MAASTACGGAVSATDVNRPTIVCTTTMIGDIAREVAMDEARVVVLFGPDVDPHLFRPTRDDVAALMRADVVLYSGFHLEGYLVETLERVAETGTRVVAVAEEILDEGEVIASAGTPDPHVWMDPSLWRRSAALVASVVGDLVPESRTRIEARASVIEERLDALDQDFEVRLQRIPIDRRVLLTAHDAFGYFGRRYDIAVEGIQGVSTASDAGLRAIEDLVDLVVDRALPAVFFESTVSERNVRALVEGAGARGHVVVIGGVLHADAPGAATSYEGMLRHNVDTIVGALAGSAAIGEAGGVTAGGPDR